MHFLRLCFKCHKSAIRVYFCKFSVNCVLIIIVIQVDLNRAGVPLLEIVSEPDMRTGIEAAEYAAELQRMVRYLGISNGNMQEGSLRCDVNVSVRPWGQIEFGTKVKTVQVILYVREDIKLCNLLRNEN